MFLTENTELKFYNEASADPFYAMDIANEAIDAYNALCMDTIKLEHKAIKANNNSLLQEADNAFVEKVKKIAKLLYAKFMAFIEKVREAWSKLCAKIQSAFFSQQKYLTYLNGLSKYKTVMCEVPAGVLANLKIIVNSVEEKAFNISSFMDELADYELTKVSSQEDYYTPSTSTTPNTYKTSGNTTSTSISDKQNDSNTIYLDPSDYYDTDNDYINGRIVFGDGGKNDRINDNRVLSSPSQGFKFGKLDLDFNDVGDSLKFNSKDYNLNKLFEDYDAIDGQFKWDKNFKFNTFKDIPLDQLERIVEKYLSGCNVLMAEPINVQVSIDDAYFALQFLQKRKAINIVLNHAKKTAMKSLKADVKAKPIGNRYEPKLRMALLSRVYSRMINIVNKATGVCIRICKAFRKEN